MQRESACLEEDQDRQRQPVDGHAGLELFRRAIQGRDEMAREQIYQQWNRLLLHWLFQHPSARLALEQAPPESYVTAALSKLWQATALAERPKRDYSNLAGALAYVRSCLNSVVLDAVRQALARKCEVGEEALAEAVMGQQSAEIAGDLWRCIERALPDRRERMLVPIFRTSCCYKRRIMRCSRKYLG
jgi:hypothetical protein